MKTDDLINALAQDAAPRRPLGRTMMLAMGGSVLAAAILFAALLGPRDEMGSVIGTMRFSFKMLLMTALAVTALGGGAALARPGARVRGWFGALAVLGMLLAVALAIELAVLPREAWVATLVGTNARLCLTMIPLLGAGPFVLLLLAARRGAPERPALGGAAAGLGAGALAATLYALHCPDDSPLFIATWYGIAIGALTLLGAAIGRKALRW
jgi:hypothetical protein